MTPKKPTPQEQMVLDHLYKHDHITPLEALGVYRIFRLAGRIFSLRQLGWNIETEYARDANGKTYAKYRLNKHNPLVSCDQPEVA